jgi:hypothetical protein
MSVPQEEGIWKLMSEGNRVYKPMTLDDLDDFFRSVYNIPKIIKKKKKKKR